MSILRALISCQVNKLLVKRSPISHILCQKVHIKIKPQIAENPPKKYKVDHYDVTNMKMGRPMSPFLTIYAAEIQGVASIHNRISGAVCALQMACFAIAALILPESVDFYVDKINSWNLPSAFIFFCKYLNAWPWCYHMIDGTRHVIWDLTALLTTKGVIISSWLVIFLAVSATIYLCNV